MKLMARCFDCGVRNRSAQNNHKSNSQLRNTKSLWKINFVIYDVFSTELLFVLWLEVFLCKQSEGPRNIFILPAKNVPGHAQWVKVISEGGSKFFNCSWFFRIKFLGPVKFSELFFPKDMSYSDFTKSHDCKTDGYLRLIQRSWFIEDRCGNIDSCLQKIYVNHYK